MSTKKAPTTQSKLSRIIQFAPDIKKFYFIDDAHRSKEYRAFMNEVTLFVQTGKKSTMTPVTAWPCWWNSWIIGDGWLR